MNIPKGGIRNAFRSSLETMDLKHPNVLAVLGIFEAKSRKFLVSERLIGSVNLHEYLNQNPNLDKNEKFDMYYINIH